MKNSSPEQLVCLHGFLGLATDWDFLRDSKFSVMALDLWKLLPRGTDSDFGLNWDRCCEQLPQLDPQSPISFVGYSMGGRLLLSLLPQVKRINKIYLISTRFRALNELQKQQRLQEDLRWKQKFLEMPWDGLINDWNQRGSLAMSKDKLYLESNYNRVVLAEALDVWSVAHQPNYEPILKEYHSRLHFITGEKDVEFSESARTFQNSFRAAQHTIVADVGHRVIFESPQAVQKVLCSSYIMAP